MNHDLTNAKTIPADRQETSCSDSVLQQVLALIGDREVPELDAGRGPFSAMRDRAPLDALQVTKVAAGG
jgi:hypothetical protein